MGEEVQGNLSVTPILGRRRCNMNEGRWINYNMRTRVKKNYGHEEKNVGYLGQDQVKENCWTV